MVIHIAQGQDFQLAERLFAHITDDVVGHLVVADIHRPLRQGSEGNDNSYLLQDYKNSCKIHLAFGND